jgi:hypothetical protein
VKAGSFFIALRLLKQIDASEPQIKNLVDDCNLMAFMSLSNCCVLAENIPPRLFVNKESILRGLLKGCLFLRQIKFNL